jgi:pSer/pThr/pTyr-binding forkhead associated (FHA) protein
MTDGLATALVILVVALFSITAAVAWWVNRPRRSTNDDEPRIQPLFAGEAVGAIDGREDDDDYLPDDEEVGARSSPGDFAAPAAPAVPNSAVSDGADPSWHSAAGLTDLNSRQTTARERAEAAAMEALRRGGAPPGWAPRGPRDPGVRPAPLRTHAAPQVDRFSPAMGSPRTRERPEWSTAAPAAGHNPYAPPAPSPGWSEGQSVRFSVPTDGTLQFLPGRLEITAGQEAGREIRFVRLPNSEPEITFGRNEGAPYRHVQLRDGTVSRLHARMRLHQGGWTLTNLSTTNPVTYNGRVLGDGEQQPLEHDDRIEMGEVAFRFRSR